MVSVPTYTKGKEPTFPRKGVGMEEIYQLITSPLDSIMKYFKSIELKLNMFRPQQNDLVDFSSCITILREKNCRKCINAFMVDTESLNVCGK